MPTQFNGGICFKVAQGATGCAQGNLTQQIDPQGREVSYEYAANGIDLLRVWVNNAGVQDTQASYTYDSVGRVSGETDSEGRTVRYAYDDLNRLTQTTYPDGTEEQRRYDTWRA